jgi:hypothetical protein
MEVHVNNNAKHRAHFDIEFVLLVYSLVIDERKREVDEEREREKKNDLIIFLGQI